MRVAMYYSNNEVRLEEQPRPTIGAGELLIKVWASGLCGTRAAGETRSGSAQSREVLRCDPSASREAV